MPDQPSPRRRVQFRLRLTIVLLVGVLGCKRENDAQKPMPDTNKPKITALTADDRSRLEKQRAVVERYIANDEDRKRYGTPAGKLGLIRGILVGKVIKPDETYKLQCLGVVLGDAFVTQLNTGTTQRFDCRGQA